MKRMLALLTSFTLMLCSCASKSFDTYFIHAACFEKTDGQVKVSAVCEKSDEGKSDYFIISQQGKSIEDATKKLIQSNKECYFATCKLICIPKDTDKNFLSDIASYLCDSNIYPTKSDVICIESAELLKVIKNADQIQSIYSLCGKSRSNTVKFLSRFMSGKDASAALFDASKDASIKRTGRHVFTKKVRVKP